MAKNHAQVPVYLDHLIQRESLRYQRSDESLERDGANTQEQLRINELRPAHEFSKVPYLRKPDFQRETNAWTPEDCVALLESIVANQVIPSVVMWKSPDELNYILDGAHRVSAIIAWLSNDWGDTPGSNMTFDDDNDEDEVELEDRQRNQARKKAAQEVRRLVKDRIGFLADFEQAERRMTDLARAGKKPSDVMSSEDYQRAIFYRRYLQGEAKLHILWAKGNYEQAELSFLRINKGGKVLSDWETRVVEDRNSSFVRTIMSIANPSSARHYWPGSANNAGIDAAHLVQKAQEIRSGIGDLHQVLFSPPASEKFKPGPHAFFWVPSVPDKPGYLAELLCVVQGRRGQSDEIDQLIQQDREASPPEIVEHGWSLIKRAEECFSHLTGASPKSLGIVPLLYFYSDKGKHIRSLLYGFLYWLLHGDRNEILQRKRSFAVHREAFEQILLLRKADIVGGIARKTGSGPEVTVPVAQYFHHLLEALDTHNDEYKSEDFSEAYRAFVKPLVSKETAPYRELEGKGRLFTPSQKSIALYSKHFANHPTCDICRGFIDLSGGLQHDHGIEYAKGGLTVASNQYVVHPFCNEPETKKLVLAVKPK